jgi:glycosyltransferase involved in cell wall biosynthesis
MIRRARDNGMAILDAVKDIWVKMVLLASVVPTRKAKDANARRKHILMVDDLLPDPLFGAGYPRACAIVRSLLRAGHEVTYYPMQSTRADRMRMNAAFGGAVLFRAGEGARGLRRLLWRDGAGFDTIFVSRPGPMQAFAEARWQSGGSHAHPTIIYDAEAVLSPREARRRILFDLPWSDEEYRSALAAELGLARGADKVTAVGKGDAEIIGSVLDTPVFVLPHPVTIRVGTPEFSDRRDILFVGRLTGPSFSTPNVDSIIWFLATVMPLLDSLIGTDYRLHIAGMTSSEEITTLLSERVVLHGVVEDLEPLYDECRIFVAPTRYAAGIPLKVIEAMGQGIPCVATPLLGKQLATGPDELATGESSEAFAQTCRRLYTDPAAWHRARQAGLAHVERHYSPATFDRLVRNVIADDVAGSTSGVG